MMLSPYLDVEKTAKRLRARSVVLDFGGTLLDFEPLHVEGFMVASGLAERSRSGVEEAVAALLRRGADSFEMATALVRLSGLAVSPHELAIAKRRVVEELLEGAILCEHAHRLLANLTEEAHVAVISRGRTASMFSVVARVDLGLAERMTWFGRESDHEHVSKLRLLDRAVGKTQSVLYVGDSAEDSAIARAREINFTLCGPFDRKSLRRSAAPTNSARGGR